MRIFSRRTAGKHLGRRIFGGKCGCQEQVLTSIVVKEAYMSVLVCCDCEGEGGMADYFVNLSWRWIICKQNNMQCREYCHGCPTDCGCKTCFKCGKQTKTKRTLKGFCCSVLTNRQIHQVECIKDNKGNMAGNSKQGLHENSKLWKIVDKPLTLEFITETEWASCLNRV